MQLRDLLRHAPVAVDQAVSSASNFLLALLVAQSASAADFGRFAIATSVYWLLLGSVRALVAEPLLILQARHGRSKPQISAAVGLAVTLAGLGSLVGIGWGVSQGVGPISLLLICLPLLIWQDLVRYSAFSLDRPGEALLSDAAWLVLLAGGGVVLLVLGRTPSVDEWLLLWAGAAALPTLVASIRLGVWPSRAGQAGWWSRSRRQAAPMLGDFLVIHASESLLIFLLPLVASYALLGQAKAAMVVNGPLSVLLTAASVVALPMLARRRQAGQDVPVRAGVLAGSAVAVVAACWGVLLLFLPAAWGEALFGEAWAGTGVYPALVAFQYAVLCFNQGAILVLRAVGEVGRVLLLRIALVPVLLVVPLVAVELGGLPAMGAAGIGLTALYGAVWWGLVLRVRRRQSAAEAEAEGVAA